MSSQYLEPHQSREREPTAYERALATALESIFADGVHDLPEVIHRLDDAGFRDPAGDPWTERSFVRVMQQVDEAEVRS
jgi:hypothetical protein